MDETYFCYEKRCDFLNNKFHIGEIYLMRFDGDEHEQSGWRPGLVFQNNIGNTYSPNIIALPLTSSIKKFNDDIPTHVKVFAKDSGLKKDSVVLCENPVAISKSKCGNLLTRLPEKYMSKVAFASIIATSAISFVDPDSLYELWEKCVSLNAV